MTKKIIIILSIILGTIASAKAIYETNYPITLSQPDGTTINCYMTGDEYYQRVHDINGYTIIRDSETGYLVYAILKNDELVSSGHIVNTVDPASIGITKNINISKEKRENIRETFWAQTPQTKKNNQKEMVFGKNDGTINNIVIYIRFADDSEFTKSASDIEDLFNKDESSYSSLYSYYKTISHEKTTINTTFYPASKDNKILSYQDIYNRSYYLPYNATTNPNGYKNETESRDREHTLLKRAIESVRSLIPSGLNLDFNGDGYIDNISFLIRGNTSEWSTLLWPHMWALYTEDVYINGKQVYTYNVLIESYTTVSVICHEMCHTLGAPDLYVYDDDGNIPTPIGRWDLMAQNTMPPQVTNTHIRQRYLGWIDEIPTITTEGTYTINNSWAATNNCYKIVVPSSNEFFLIEYRDKSVYWDSNIPGTGLTIYRINSSVDGNYSSDYPFEAYIFRPGAANSSAKGDINSAFFSKQSGRTSFDDNTNPPAFLYNNLPSGISISNISESGGETMSFNVNFSPTINVTSPDFDFGGVSIKLPSTKTVNISTVFLTENIQFEIVGDDAEYFTATAGSTWNNLLGGSLSIVFAPDEVRDYSAKIVFNSGSANNSINLTGKGIVVPPSVSISPVSINFGNVELYENSIVKTAQISGINLTDSVEYDITGDEESIAAFQITKENWDPNSGGKINIIFAPQEEGSFQAQIVASTKGANSTKTLKLSGTGVPNTTTIPVADFTSNTTEILKGNSINFYDMSIGKPNSFKWTFEGGTPSTSTLKNPVVKYNSPGIYMVSLTVENTLGISEIVKENYIIVNDNNIDVKEEKLSELLIYPNPTNGIINIKSENMLKIQLFNILGNIITEEKITQNNTSINIENFAKGIYFLKVFMLNGNYRIEKIVLQ